MASLTALEKHPCAACGAQAEWNPAKQRLVCPFCGTEAPYEKNPKTGVIEEIDLVKTLRELPAELRGWKADKKTVQCRSCHAVSVFDPVRVAQNCEFCGSPSLVDYAEIKAPIRPQSILPFKVSDTQVRETIRQWMAGVWFAPNALKKKALVDTLHGLYVPYWTFDAHAECPWTAEAGHYYYTTETYRDDKGRTQTRQVQHVRWEPAAGRVEHFFDDEPVPGTRGIHANLLRQVEPFPTTDLVPYDTAFLSGFVVEHYQVVLIDAAKIGQDAMVAQLRQMCAAQVPGDTQRNLQIAPTFGGQTFKHILVPVWLLTYNYGTRTYQVVINGYTAKMAGEYPKSFWKIFFLALFVLAIVLIVLYNQ
ncbi:MAG: hypothetical protein U0Q12_27775 [Vicinamibacterales bacterium]